ncbi:LacI family DNA-binding transcriptional regulator [Microbispora bryophytorum]|uniref:LacI family DNA-binding transcriptional regulator n=1 Tax=Microbispora bryophytorum TaxID=1460882 RepID=UPI0033C0308D
MATTRELARLCGVSPATVSRVFNNPEVVNAKTREQVLRTARQIGYLPNESARTLATKKSFLVSPAGTRAEKGPRTPTCAPCAGTTWTAS